MPTGDKDCAHLRAAPRIKIFQPAEMARGTGVPTRVHLLNVSTGGALVYGEQVPEIGEEVRLACGIPLGAARVRWRSGQRFGVAFARPIAPAQVETLVRAQVSVGADDTSGAAAGRARKRL